MTNTIEPIYVALRKDELILFNNVKIIQIMDYLYTSSGKVVEIYLEKNQVNIIMEYAPKLPMAILTNQLEESQKISWSGKHFVTDMMMISKGITLLNNRGVYPHKIK